MVQRRTLSAFAGPLLLTGLLLCARLAAVPALYDTVAGTPPDELYLKIPWTYLILAPLFTLWDGVSMLSMSRLVGFLTGLLVLYLVWRFLRGWYRRKQDGAARASLGAEVAALAFSLILFIGFVVAGAMWHRPMLSLVAMDPRDIVVDFHSHTNVSHDVRDTWMRGFGAEANRRWHGRAGFDAAFITDHNVISRESAVASRKSSTASTVLCPGIEVSVWRAHIVLLGDTLPVDRSRYKSFDGLLALLASSDSAYGALSLASLPEYRRNHWGRLDSLAAAGLDGFEIVNASPKANELTRAETDTVIAVARAHNRFVAGVSDSHGWGATSMVWNVVRSAGGPPADTCSSVLQQLRTGFQAVRIIERHRLRPDDWWPVWLTPVGMVWETWRGMGWALTASWLAWIWAWTLVRRRARGSLRFIRGQPNVRSSRSSSLTG
jgi:hypothetical protein